MFVKESIILVILFGFSSCPTRCDLLTPYWRECENAAGRGLFATVQDLFDNTIIPCPIATEPEVTAESEPWVDATCQLQVFDYFGLLLRIDTVVLVDINVTLANDTGLVQSYNGMNEGTWFAGGVLPGDLTIISISSTASSGVICCQRENSPETCPDEQLWHLKKNKQGKLFNVDVLNFVGFAERANTDGTATTKLQLGTESLLFGADKTLVYYTCANQTSVCGSRRAQLTANTPSGSVGNLAAGLTNLGRTAVISRNLTLISVSKGFFTRISAEGDTTNIIKLASGYGF